MYTTATRYDTHNAAFTNLCHVTARKKVYPVLFDAPTADIDYTDCDLRGSGSAALKRLDGERGIDKIVEVRYDGLRLPLKHTVQERFQRPTHAHERNVTITEWNDASNTPSELFKLEAQWFVSGFFSEDAQSIIELIAVGSGSLLAVLGPKRAHWDRRRNNKGQPFIRITFEELLRKRLVSLHIRNDVVLLDALSDPFTDNEDGDAVVMTPDGNALFKWPNGFWRYDRPQGVKAL